MAAVIPAIERPTAPESDYGSDFSVEEQCIVIQLLEDIQNAQTPTPEPRGGKALQEDIDAAITAGIFATASVEDLDSGDQDASAAADNVDPDLGSHPSSPVKVPALLPASRTSSVAVDGLQVSSLPMDGINYPDRRSTLS
jgi:hypothetical protein